MNPSGRYSRNYVMWVSFMVSLCVLAVSLGGCTTLRRKFTRKKKEKTSEQAFIPVLDPIDYPPPSISPEERYRYHYSLWKVWHRDLVQNVERRESDKRQKFLVNQAIVQLEEMKKWMNAEKQKELAECISGWREVLAMYDRPAAMRSDSAVKRKIEANAKKIRNQFNPDVARDFLIGLP